MLTRILQLRQEKAGLLGFANHAEVSMASKVRLPFRPSFLSAAASGGVTFLPLPQTLQP